MLRQRLKDVQTPIAALLADPKMQVLLPREVRVALAAQSLLLAELVNEVEKLQRANDGKDAAR